MFKIRKWIIFTLLSCFALPSYGVIELKSNLFFSFLSSNGSDLITRSFNSLYVGGGGFHVGGVYLYDPLHDYLTDTGYGAGIKFGENLI